MNPVGYRFRHSIQRIFLWGTKINLTFLYVVNSCWNCYKFIFSQVPLNQIQLIHQFVSVFHGFCHSFDCQVEISMLQISSVALFMHDDWKNRIPSNIYDSYNHAIAVSAILNSVLYSFYQCSGAITWKDVRRISSSSTLLMHDDIASNPSSVMLWLI